MTATIDSLEGYGAYVRPGSASNASSSTSTTVNGRTAGSTSGHIRRRSSSASSRGLPFRETRAASTIASSSSDTSGDSPAAERTAGSVLSLAQRIRERAAAPSSSSSPSAQRPRGQTFASTSTDLTSWTDLEKGLEGRERAPSIRSSVSVRRSLRSHSQSTYSLPQEHRRTRSATSIFLATSATTLPEQGQQNSAEESQYAPERYSFRPIEHREVSEKYSDNRSIPPSYRTSSPVLNQLAESRHPYQVNHYCNHQHPQKTDRPPVTTAATSNYTPDKDPKADSWMPPVLRSSPLRLLAYSILFFNCLIVLKVLAIDTEYDYPAPMDQIRISAPALKPATFVDMAVQDVPVVNGCSHNDEMQPVPFSEAMSLGFQVIEVDVHLVDNILLAGHEPQDLSPEKTLRSVYLDPLYAMLERANRNAEGNLTKRPQEWNSDDWTGIFPSAPKQDLMLMIDVKMDPEGTFEALVSELKPFIARNWLTVYRDGKLIQGPLTIVGTGTTPIELVYRASPRYVFKDAPLVRIQHPLIIDGETVEWGPELAPIASSKWLWWHYYPDVAALSKFSDAAHERGMKARWWGVMRWPTFLRQALWNLQLRAGVDIINADDLAELASYLRLRKEANLLAQRPSVEDGQASGTSQNAQLLGVSDDTSSRT